VLTLLQRRETRDAVRQEIARLPEAYRTVLTLRDLEELDTEETARLLGQTTSTVKSRLHRARQALRSLLDQHLRGERPHDLS
jgi:RNA polymerase sigma-70 factor (ECF subfamily)